MATPVYLIASLIGIGYYLNKDGREERVSIKRKKVSKHDKPNSKEIYNSDTVKKARRQEQNMANKLWKKSKKPIETNIIPPMFNNRKSKQQRPAVSIKKSSGVPIKQSQQKIIQKEKDIIPLSNVSNTQGWKPVVKRESQHTQKRPGFFHNNMEPFFGGSIKQNMKPDLYRTKLEHFTGAQPSYKHKKEVKRLFKPVKQNIFGNQVQKDRGLERYWISDKKPNEKPFEQIKVGPGVGLKVNEKSKHGFHDSYRPKYKTVDELRVKPKVSYKGRILKGDLINLMSATPKPSDRKTQYGQEERIRMTRLRMTIAKRLKQAQETAAILTTFNEVDMSSIIQMRKDHQEDFKNRFGIKLGFMSFFVKACIVGLKIFPAINAEIDNEEIVYKNYYNISFAVGTDKGLVVPVLKNADELSFADIEKNIKIISEKARDGKLAVEDLQGGTFTISNGGVYGSMLSTPILNTPQSGVLGMHNVIERPVVINGEILIKPVMYLALSYDHRIIDGKDSVSFLKCIKENLEDPRRLFLDL